MDLIKEKVAKHFDPEGSSYQGVPLKTTVTHEFDMDTNDQVTGLATVDILYYYQKNLNGGSSKVQKTGMGDRILYYVNTCDRSLLTFTVSESSRQEAMMRKKRETETIRSLE